MLSQSIAEYLSRFRDPLFAIQTQIDYLLLFLSQLITIGSIYLSGPRNQSVSQLDTELRALTPLVCRSVSAQTNIRFWC